MMFPSIDLKATGENIVRLRKRKGITVKELQVYFGFEQPQAIYKWQWGDSLPSVDNLFALSKILEVPMQEILVESDQDFVVYRRINLLMDNQIVLHNFSLMHRKTSLVVHFTLAPNMAIMKP